MNEARSRRFVIGLPHEIKKHISLGCAAKQKNVKQDNFAKAIHALQMRASGINSIFVDSMLKDNTDDIETKVDALDNKINLLLQKIDALEQTQHKIPLAPICNRCAAKQKNVKTRQFR